MQRSDLAVARSSLHALPFDLPAVIAFIDLGTVSFVLSPILISSFFFLFFPPVFMIDVHLFSTRAHTFSGGTDGASERGKGVSVESKGAAAAAVSPQHGRRSGR